MVLNSCTFNGDCAKCSENRSLQEIIALLHRILSLFSSSISPLVFFSTAIIFAATMFSLFDVIIPEVRKIPTTVHITHVIFYITMFAALSLSDEVTAEVFFNERDEVIRTS